MSKGNRICRRVDEFLIWKVGDCTLTRIVEQSIAGDLDGLIPDATAEALAAHDWLSPDHVLPDGRMRFSVHAIGIRTPTRKILVDTCVGNERARAPLAPFWDGLNISFLASLEAAGFGPHQVDTVICTHLHLDHVGWNTHRVRGQWVPTFPRARYLFGRREYHHALDELAEAKPDDPLGGLLPLVFADSIQPVVEAGLVDLVDDDYRVCEEVRLVPTPGHTPGHVAVSISSGGEEAVITGDAIHHPCQLAHPEWGTLVDWDGPMAAATRRSMLDDAAARRTLMIGSHWAGSSGGLIVPSGSGYRLKD